MAFFLICRNEPPYARLSYVPDHQGDVMTNRMTTTSMVSRIDRAISPLSPARTRIRRLANRRKIQTGAASRAAANKQIRNANENELFSSTRTFLQQRSSHPPSA